MVQYNSIYISSYLPVNLLSVVSAKRYNDTENNIITSPRNDSDAYSLPQPYIKVSELFRIWKEYSTRDGDASAYYDPKDALHLLEAQGGIFTHDGLAFIRPAFITDLMVALVDHMFTHLITLL